jgi:hypothetical protein
MILPSSQIAKIRKLSMTMPHKIIPPTSIKGNSKIPIAIKASNVNKNNKPTKNACIFSPPGYSRDGSEDKLKLSLKRG